MIVDSTGLSFGRASEWCEQKHGHKAARTPWRKMHLSIDTDMNVHGIRMTTTDVSDNKGMDSVLPADVPLDRVIADGAYYSIERTEALSRAGVTPLIPWCTVKNKRNGTIRSLATSRKKASMHFTTSTATACVRWLRRRSRASSVASASAC